MSPNILHVLILGGTYFLGPHLVHELQENGHKVTVFNRGTQTADFSDVEYLKGDRDGGLETLKGRKWDAVIDTSGHLPRLVQDSSEILTDAASHYTFISSVGVYQDFLQDHIDESYPSAELLDSGDEQITEKTYGALKAACEQAVKNYFNNRSLIIRPGLIVGPLDPTDRFAYWPLRVLDGGQVLAPGDPNHPVQFIDARDLSKWIVKMVERKATGVYNATGRAIPFGNFLEECKSVVNRNAEFIWVAEDFLLEHQVQDWAELPLWLSYKRAMPGFMNVSVDKAIEAGLVFRPLSETLTDTIDWCRKNNKDQVGMEREKESSLLDAWRAQN